MMDAGGQETSKGAGQIVHARIANAAKWTTVATLHTITVNLFSTTSPFNLTKKRW